MKKISTLVLSLLCISILSAQDFKELIAEGTHTVQSVVQVAETHFDSVGRGRGTGYKPFRRWQYFAERAMDETGKLKSPQFYYDELLNYNLSNNDEGLAARTVVGTWEEMGPTYWNATSGYNPGVGRITSMSVDPNNMDHIIAGGETGGVWKSLDGGVTWIVLTDNLSNMDVYSLAIDPLNSSRYFWGSTSGAIFRSEDGGSTWTLHGNLPGGTVNKILVHPTDSNILYASSQGSGLYKSTNGGSTWTSIYFVSTGNGFDFEFKPGDPNTIYASGNKFYLSTNGGMNFTEVSGTASNQFSNGPKMIGVSEDNPSVVYVVEAFNGAFGGLYKSTDSGSTFVKLNHVGKNYFGYSTDPQDPSDAGVGQAPRDMDIAVNPNDINDVHIAGINTWRSTDGGLNFTNSSQWTPYGASINNIGYCHADVDLLQFAGSGANAKLFVCTDGGIYKAENPTLVNSNYYTDLTPGMGIRQFYKIGVSQTNPVVVTGGSQDNGSSVLGSDGNWTDWWGADGMEGFVDKNNTQIMYGTSQFGSFIKTFNGGLSISGVSQPDGKGGDYNWNWIVPFEQDPIVQNTIYCAFDEVYKSENGGSTWTSISQNFGDDIDHLKIAPSNNNFMYLAINGSFWYTVNGGGFWSQSSFNGGWINSIAVHPTDPTKIAIATTNNQKVYVSTDNGVSWTSIKWDLPSFASQAVVWQDNGNDGLYVGMNYGIYYTDNDLGNTWTAFNNGLPNVRINELEINTADDKIYAATYGRGLWRSNVYDESLSVTNFEFEDFAMFPNPTSGEVNLKWDSSEDVSVRIFNSLGKIVFYAKGLNLQNGQEIDVSSFNSGVYFVKLNSSKGEITKKLILK
ncbi:T9SS type A sorting domain-containing protein [Winogradskyella sp. SYSU M77433]|uniref:T9SS type A sorting domain-containing protein n=1 Tax=Winogradskyella sp. SYSU M77433 TaxID=3042722 RepID=UPI002480F3D3|nr:T9SS type A sorting domain-containing protein [Winogradskyella sp. SYSU M77433]MDH7913088.1 T9SS type A sorting domain-containing protein [Winogradskyella sp. SYSU M77433]